MILSLISIVVIFFCGYILIEDKRYIYYVDNGNSKFINLVIPGIGLDVLIYNFDSIYNDVDYNVSLLDSSDLDSNTYYFASHSGTGDNCYFNRVKEIEVGDVVYVFYKNNRLVYEVVDKYFIVKNGYMEVDKYLEDVLFLITCSGYNQQLIVKGLLIN